MAVPDDISMHELILLMKSYCKYITEATESNKCLDGWRPVSLNEFYDWDFKNLTEYIEFGIDYILISNKNKEVVKWIENEWKEDTGVLDSVLVACEICQYHGVEELQKIIDRKY